MLNNIILNVDSYKTSHWKAYPSGTEYISSYIEPRGGEFNEIVFCLLQAFCIKYLLPRVTMEQVETADILFRNHGSPFNKEGWKYIVEKHGGSLPIRIEALPEGTIVSPGTAVVQVINTDPKCYWLTSYIETALLRAIWYPTTVASLSYKIKKLLHLYATMTSENEDVSYKLVDFGSRGASSLETSQLGGMAHQLLFKASDNIPGVVGHSEFYGADFRDAGKISAQSIAAGEHSTYSTWGRSHEVDAYRNMINLFGEPGKMFAVVSDTYDIFNAVDNIWGKELKDELKMSGATAIIRPDSGDPITVLPRLLQSLWASYGGAINRKGYKALDGSVRLIWGDGINYATIESICRVLAEDGWSLDNVSFGMGGALLQQVNRDTCSFAMKASAAKVDDEWRDVFKDPVTDIGKRSKRGRLAVTKDHKTVRLEKADSNLLEIVYENGELKRFQSLDEVRSRLI